jgi:hypothetical protein
MYIKKINNINTGKMKFITKPFRYKNFIFAKICYKVSIIPYLRCIFTAHEI